MNASARFVALAAALLSLAAVVLAALGSHLIDMKGLQGVWQTASIVHMFNAAALIGLAALLSRMESFSLKWGAWLIVLGTLVFSGSIYLHIITGQQILGITPAGGVLMMTGWCLVVLAFLRKS
jgi:uncharacterized membrane protein YgdD (TMEM256/DUF423 family)